MPRHNHSSLFVRATEEVHTKNCARSDSIFGAIKTRKVSVNLLEVVGGEKRDFRKSFQSVHLTKTLLDTFRRKEEREKGQIVIADSFPFDGERDGITFSSAATMKNFSNGK